MKKILILISLAFSYKADAQWTFDANFYVGFGVNTSITDFCFLNDSTGIVTTNNHYSGTGGPTDKLYTTNNFGTGWSTTATHLGYPPVGWYLHHIQNSDTVLRINYPYMEFSIDMGHNWSTLFLMPWSLGYFVAKISFINSTYGVIAEAGSYFELDVLRYNNGSTNIVDLTPYGYVNASDLQMTNKSKGYMICNANTKLIATSDSGFTWTTILDTNALFSHIEFPSPSIGYLTCDSGKIFKTIDAGASWNLLNTGTTQDLAWSSFINDTVGFFCGDKGTILRTKDGGLTWDDESIPFVGYLLQIEAINDMAYCIDSSDNMYRKFNATGIKENTDPKTPFSLFPNPVKNQITIGNMGMQKINSIRILNSLGQVEYSQIIGNNNAQIKIDLPELPSGVKYCRINGEENFTYKIIIE